MLELLTLPPSPHNTKVRLALRHKGLDFTQTLVDLADRGPVVARSGQPLTPVLIDGDKAVYDSFGIVRYLDANWPEPRLFPSDREGMRAVEGWERFALAELGAPLLLVGGEPDDEANAKAQAGFNAAARKLELALEAGPYLLGAQLTAADLTVAPMARFGTAEPEVFPAGSPPRIIAERVRLDPVFTRTRAWVERVFALDAGLA